MTTILRCLGVLSAVAFLFPEFRNPYGFAASMTTAIVWFAFAAALGHLRAIRNSVESIEVRMLRSAANTDEIATTHKSPTLMSESEIALAEQTMKAALERD